MSTVERVAHPAKFSDVVLVEVARHITPDMRVLDPFAGTGKIHQLQCETVGVELEPEWAEQHPDTIVGNSLDLEDLFPSESFDGVITSPCLEQSHRILTSDLRWVPAGDIEIGDEVMAFDEFSQSLTATNRASRRRWRKAIVTRSVARRRKCLRVILANGDEFITTPEHPWLSERYDYGGRSAEWTESRDLMGRPPLETGQGAGRGWNRGARQPFFVMKQLEPWTIRTSYDAGWLAGMYDGEGSVTLGAHGSPKLVMYQVLGPVTDRAEKLMNDFGYAPNRVIRTGTPAHCQKVANLYVTDGFPGIMKALGELRPMRLLEKWLSLDISTRTIHPSRVQVVAVEDAGVHNIQEIETTTGTYVGEGYLHHNCYGSRMADHHNARDDSKRITYRHCLGRPLHADNSGQMQWADGEDCKYKVFHRRAWQQAVYVLKSGGLFILNCSDHIRAGEVQLVTQWHVDTLKDLGCRVVNWRFVYTPRMGFGENRAARVDYESVVVMRKHG